MPREEKPHHATNKKGTHFAKTHKNKNQNLCFVLTYPTLLSKIKNYMAKKNAGERLQQQKNAYLSKISAQKREIGDIPPIADVERRLSTRDSFRHWCEVYEASSFTMDWSDDHLEAIAKLEHAVLYGTLYAFAMPRGSGKTSLVRACTRWAISHAHRHYVFIIGANIGKAQDSLDSIKTFMRFNQQYAQDFPEISYPIQSLGGIANRASGQTCNGVSTMIEWGKDRIALPCVPWPSNHPMYAEGLMCGTGGRVVGASGLTGDGIRGSLVTTASGESLRPDMVLLDDPQTDQSAASPTQNITRERLVMGAVLGMAGPGKDISAVMPCTVIQPGDMVDRILDRKRNPQWQGTRTKMLRSMPKNLEAWEKYREVYDACSAKTPPDYDEANSYYTTNQESLDEGAEASWPARKKDTEVSAIQHAMHLYFRDELAFWAEYQNDPRAIEVSDEGFWSAEDIAGKASGVERRIVPPDCTTLSSFIDVQGEALYWAVCAWSDGFGGQVIDYGTWPEQGLRHFTLRSLKKTLDDQYPGMDVNGAIYSGLIELCKRIMGAEWQTAGGDVMRVSHGLVDAGWGDSTKTVYRACRDSEFASVLSPSFGRSIKAGNKPMADWPKEVGEVMGHGWRRRLTKNERVRHVLYDTNLWKTLVHQRLATPLGNFGSLALYKASATHHRQFADHLKAEPHTRTTGQGRELIEWGSPVAGRDNHWFDCLVGSAVAASIAGVGAMGHETSKKPKRKRISLSQIQEQKRAR